LAELGYIKSKDNAKLGYLCSDIKKEGVIIYEKNEAPKTYMYEYINNENQVADQECGVMKCKGIPKYDKSRPLYNTDGSLKIDKDGKMVYTKLLTSQMYKEHETNKDICKVSFGGLKRKHKTLTKKDIESGVGHFSIVNSYQTRTFMNTSWKGMIFHNGEWYPKGYEF
jgi:hypothetical protein